MRKGEMVTVMGPAGRGINCPLMDIDHTDNKIWVRFPHNETVEMRWDPKRQVYFGRVARLEFTVKPEAA